MVRVHGAFVRVNSPPNMLFGLSFWGTGRTHFKSHVGTLGSFFAGNKGLQV